MKRLLIVDDEISVAQGIANYFDWNSLRICEVRCAYNGYQAFEMCKTYLPQIILTDIEMPIMNGIELSEQLSKLYPNIKIVYFTGYWQEKYLKSALDKGVINCLQKPIDQDELTRILEKIVNQIDIEENTNQYISRINERLTQALPAMNEKLMLSLLNGCISSVDHLVKSFEFYGFRFPSFGWFGVIIILLCSKSAEKNRDKAYSIQTGNVIAYYINKYLYEIFDGCCIKNQNDSIVCVYGTNKMQKDEIIKYLKKILDRIKNGLFAIMRDKITIGVGEIVCSPLQLNLSFTTAQQCIHHRFFTGNGNVIWSEQIVAPKESAEYNFRNEISAIRNFFQIGELDKGIETIEKIFQKLSQQSNDRIPFCRSICMLIYNEIKDLLMNSQYSNQADLQKLETNMSSIITASELNEIFQTIRETIENISKKIYKAERGHDIVNRVKVLINERYQENLQICDIAKQVFISPSYLCFLFKRETGYSIKQYIIMYRIKKAEVLLRIAGNRIVDVAQSVGFCDSKYFSKQFKKMTGKTPSEYQKAYRKNENNQHHKLMQQLS